MRTTTLRLALVPLIWCVSFASAHAASSSPQDSVVQGNTAFTVDLYGQIEKQTGNLCFSPYGVSSSLAMTYAGARGRTEQEIATTMHFKPSQEALHGAFRAVGASIQGLERSGIAITQANSLWCQTASQLDDNYVSLLRNNYQAEALRADFSDCSASANKINSWFLDRTKGKIKNIVESRQITPSTRAILCNAVYFKGEWATKFDKSTTKAESFYTGPELSVMVPMMRAESKFKIVREDDFSLLELPYVGKKLSMLLFLPTANDGLQDFEKQFTADHLKLWLAKLNQASEAKAFVRVPRLKMSCSLALSDTLGQMGMPSLFSEKDSDLSGITGKRDLFISSIVHQATLDVSEEGTEAAAGTAAQVKTKSQPLSFIANHPFFFLLVENRSGNILFCGRVINPSKS
jgi:serpin B